MHRLDYCIVPAKAIGAMKRSFIIILIAGIVVYLCFDAFAFDDEDWQYWNTENISIKLADDWKLGLEEEFWQNQHLEKVQPFILSCL